MGLPKIALLLFWACYCYATENAYLGDLPLENPDLLGGDILDTLLPRISQRCSIGLISEEYAGKTLRRISSSERRSSAY
ncbi:hypothetical protein TNCT_636491 [Trichonephila clavata]|uniref:Uncharacterized protein n=1 Tax=Trichonephila clavata TaxID=2740835 RepID=A0A8X6JX58_TRICU|nr:hypothetical protein TNCT_636491 [Trichonephila clavata]